MAPFAFVRPLVTHIPFAPDAQLAEVHGNTLAYDRKSSILARNKVARPIA